MSFRLRSSIHAILPAAALIAAACSSQPPRVAEAPMANPPNIIHFDQPDRAPAQAPDQRWVPATLNVDVRSSNGAATANAQVTVNQELSWWEDETFNDTCTEYRDVLSAYTCTDLVCSAGSGKSPAWDAFYTATKEERAAKLADAIKGIGEKTAPKLVAGGYFHSKPKSWDAFVAEVNRAADAGVIQKSVATQIIYTYRGENAANLGYGTGSCTEKARTCTVYQPQLVSYICPKTRRVQRSKVVDQHMFNVNVQISNAKLLPIEQDSISLSIDQNGGVNPNVSGTYNRYQATSQMTGPQQIAVNVVGVQRYLRPLPESVVRQSSFTLVNKVPTFVLDVDPSLIPDAQDPQAQLVLNYTIKSCDVSWFTGACKAFSSYKTLKVDSKPITQGRTVLAFDNGSSGTKNWVEYTVARPTSAYFDDHPISSHNSDTIKF